MVTRMLASLPLLAAAAAAAWSLQPPPEAVPPATASVTVLDRMVADYLEDAVPARPVAEVRAELRRLDGGVRLRLTVAAVGARVDPVPGLAGVQGSNLRTAEELHRLLRDQDLGVTVRAASGGERGGVVTVNRRATLPTRRIRPDGTLDLDAHTAAEWPVEVHFDSSGLDDGISHIYVMAEGVPRLRAQVEVGAGSGRILSIESLGQNLATRRTP